MYPDWVNILLTIMGILRVWFVAAGCRCFLCIMINSSIVSVAFIDKLSTLCQDRIPNKHHQDRRICSYDPYHFMISKPGAQCEENCKTYGK